VPTELHVYPGAFHACTWLVDVGICQTVLGDVVDALRRGLRATALSVV
jgi:hypothetical protein